MIIIFLYLLFVACIHAKLEVMIEGREGWARKLPCWRLNIFLVKWLLGKELTGYHFYLMILFISLFHGIFLVTPWSWGKEALVFGCFFWYWIFEDFLWFIANKHYGLKAFKKGKIKWHSRWILGLPVSYWTFMILGTVLIFIGNIIT